MLKKMARVAMKRLLSLSMLCFILVSCVRIPRPTPEFEGGAAPTSALETPTAPALPDLTPSSAPSTLPATQTPNAGSGANQFGVMISGQDVAHPEIVNIVKDLGAHWVRLNWALGESSQDYTLFLASGINVVLTISNRESSNIDTTYGTLRQFPSAGFPFKSKTQYQQGISAALQPATAYLAQGRQVWVQAENEISDAALNPGAVYWRGTDEQYLAQLQALYEAVKSVDTSIPVILTSFASQTLDALNGQDSARQELVVKHVKLLLSQAQFDVVDLHFYGCVEDIPAKVRSVKEYMPAGKPFIWISTENGGSDARCETTPLSWKQDLGRFEQTQAEQVSARLSACAGNDASICLWFSLLDLKRSEDVFSHLGLLDQDTNPPREKPAYAAFEAFIAKQK